MYVKICPDCGAKHAHGYYYCQECEYEMNPKEPVRLLVQIPKHFRAANEGNYTMAELRRDNDAGFRLREKAGM